MSRLECDGEVGYVSNGMRVAPVLIMEEVGCSLDTNVIAKKKRLSLRSPRQSSPLEVVDAEGGFEQLNAWKDGADVELLDGITDTEVGVGKVLLPGDTPGDSEGRLEVTDSGLKAKPFILDEFCDVEEELPFDVLEEVLSQYDKPAAKPCHNEPQWEAENAGVEGLDFSEHTEDFKSAGFSRNDIRYEDAFDDSSAFRDDLSFDVESRDPGETDSQVKEETPRDSEDLSFRDAFYKSGSDWSSLHEVDEYGLPYARSSPPSIYGRGDAELVEPQSSLLDNKENQTNHSQRNLKQGDLSSFLGFKRKLPPDANVAPKRTEQRDIGTYFGLAPLAKQASSAAANFVSKSRPGFTSSAPAPGDQRKGWKSSIRESTRGCPFYKRMPGTPFTVDAFKFGAVEGCTAYFLTHFHSDHYGGLTRSWCHGPIFCTEITARLVSMHLGVDSYWLRPVKLDVLIVVEGVEVKFLEANHCPGAALILFQTRCGQRILHTGDFRACKAMQGFPDLLPSRARITSLYLDTTYCNPKYNFPLQEDVIRHVVRLSTAALARNPRTLVAVGAYSIGKERVYLGIAKALNLAIFADKRRARTLRALDWPDLTSRLCSDARSSKLHVLPISHLNATKLRAYMQSFPVGTYNAVLAFRPTGWTYSEKVGCNLEELRPQCSGVVTIYGVPYSEHSSFSELQEFVRFLRPQKIVATVNVGSAAQRESMQAHFNQWLKS